MPTNPDLAALSAAAKWLRECSNWLLSTNLDMKCPMMADPLDLADDLDALATGNIVQIDRDGMRALHERIVSRPHDAPMHIEHLLDDADAAIAAILGGEGA